MTQTSGPGETAGALVFSLTRMYVRYSFAPMSAYVEKGHGPLLVAVCAGLFCMPFMMAGGAPCCPCWEKNCTPPQGSWDSLAQPTRLALPCFSLAAAVWATFGGTDASSCGERHFLPWQARLKALFLPLAFFLFFRYAFPASWRRGSQRQRAGLAGLSRVTRPPCGLFLFQRRLNFAGVACSPAAAGILADTPGWRWL